MIDVHFSERRRQPHVKPILQKHPRLRAIGIDELTGTVTIVGGGAVGVLKAPRTASARTP